MFSGFNETLISRLGNVLADSVLAKVVTYSLSACYGV